MCLTINLLQKTRKREIVQARQITMYLAKAFTKNSLKTIGEHFGGRDHTTVIHSCQTVKDLMDTDSIFRENVMELTQKVQLGSDVVGVCCLGFGVGMKYLHKVQSADYSLIGTFFIHNAKLQTRKLQTFL